MKELDPAWAQWTPADITRVAADAIAAREAALLALKAVPAADRTFDNTIGALEDAGGQAADVQQVLQLLAGVHPDARIRDVAQAAHDRMDEANVAMAHDRDIWDAVMAWEATGKRGKLGGEDRKLADDTLRNLKRVGFHLPETDFTELRSLRTQLQKLESEFERAINEWDDCILVTRDELDGLPERYIAGLQRDGDRYRVSMAYPELFPFMDLAEADAPRRELAHKVNRKGGSENLERLARMISVRQRIAGILGYPTHADFVEEVRMSKTAKTATDFTQRIVERLRPAAARQLKELVLFKKQALGLEHPLPIGFHEVAYWSYRLKKERYGLEGEKVKAYFPLARVLAGMMDMYQGILGVRFARLPDVALWHPDVQAYAVHNQADGRLFGHFFLDLHPRAGKYGHAAWFPIRLGRQGRGDTIPGLHALICNFPKPTESDPALLDHDEVETLLHEFGHVMHGLLSAGRWQGQNGAAVPLDFVEALSQIFEYWALHPASLAKISGHWQTGEPLPQELLDKMQAVRREQGAMYYLCQAVRSLYDLRIHGQPTDAPVSASALAALHRDMRLEYEAIDLPDDAIYPAGWGHMADYDAGYYGYLWSKVYAADMFTRFASDPLSAVTGMRYRTAVLEPGASRPELELISDFLDREPSDAAFLAELGIS